METKGGDAMGPICLVGPGSGALARRLFQALAARPVGYSLVRFNLDGREKGLLLRLLATPAGEPVNDVPCVVRVGDADVVVHEAFDRVAAPALRRALAVHGPLLLEGLTAAQLTPGPFREAVAACMARRGCTVLCLAADAESILRGMPGGERAMYCAVTPENEAALLEELQGACYLGR